MGVYNFLHHLTKLYLYTSTNHQYYSLNDVYIFYIHTTICTFLWAMPVKMILPVVFTVVYLCKVTYAINDPLLFKFNYLNKINNSVVLRFNYKFSLQLCVGLLLQEMWRGRSLKCLLDGCHLYQRSACIYQEIPNSASGMYLILMFTYLMYQIKFELQIGFHGLFE